LVFLLHFAVGLPGFHGVEVPDFSPLRTWRDNAAAKEVWPQKTREATKRGALQIRVMGFDQVR
jgi:hypothetical protein